MKRIVVFIVFVVLSIGLGSCTSHKMLKNGDMRVTIKKSDVERDYMTENFDFYIESEDVGMGLSPELVKEIGIKALKRVSRTAKNSNTYGFRNADDVEDYYEEYNQYRNTMRFVDYETELLGLEGRYIFVSIQGTASNGFGVNGNITSNITFDLEGNIVEMSAY